MTNYFKLAILISILAISSCKQSNGQINFENVDTSTYRNIPALVPYREGKLWGFSNAEGRLIVPVQFYNAKILSDSLFAGFNANGDNKTYLYNASALLLGTYDGEVAYFLLGKNRVYPYTNDKLFIFWKRAESKMLGNSMQYSGERKAYIYNSAGRFQFDSTGFLIEEFQSNKNVMAIGKYIAGNVKWGLVDTSGLLIVPIDKDEINPLDYLDEHLHGSEDEVFSATGKFILNEGQRKGVFNARENIQIVPAIYDSISMIYAQDVFGQHQYAYIVGLDNKKTDIYTTKGRKIFSGNKNVMIGASYSGYIILEEDGFASIVDTAGNLVAHIAKAKSYGLVKTGYILAIYSDYTVAMKLATGETKKLKGVLDYIPAFAIMDVPYISSVYDGKIALFDPNNFNQVVPYIFSKGDFGMAYGQVLNDGNPMPGLYWVEFQYDRSMWRGKGYINSKGFQYWKD